MAEVKRAFNPEFLNRLDEVILFQSLTDDDLIKIIGLLVGQINQNLVAKEIKLRLTPEASKYILEKTCNDRSFGARPLRRALQKYIEDPLSEALIQGSPAASGRPRDLPRRSGHLLPPGQRGGQGRRGSAGGRGRRAACAGHAAVHVLRPGGSGPSAPAPNKAGLLDPPRCHEAAVAPGSPHVRCDRRFVRGISVPRPGRGCPCT